MKQNQKPCITRKKVIDRGKRSKTLSEVKQVKNISKNLQSFLEISPMQKEVLPSHKLRHHAYEYWNPFGLKEDNLSQRNCQNQLSHYVQSKFFPLFRPLLFNAAFANLSDGESQGGLFYFKGSYLIS